MIKVLLELELCHPYRVSLDTLLAFCCVWDSVILYGGTNRETAGIAIPLRHFKKIFKVHPEIKSYSIPVGMEKFISSIRVKKVIVK